jgi:UDP-N-acetylmuramyl pentapeptide phosphotransferase/UDP-N-acetylglucosamine-1-phosphate transferase
MLHYSIISIILLSILLIYFWLAEKFDIIDKPNERSSHSTVTIRGGAIIIPIAFVLASFFSVVSWYLPVAIILVAIVSFVDDIKGLHQIPRLIAHITATLIIFYITGLIGYQWYVQLIVAILLIGWINAFNFMDGINGIMVLYGLVNLGVFYYLADTAKSKELLLITIIATSIFAFFNVRKKAKAFAGDVGSVSLAFILAYFMLDLIQRSGRLEYILFFSVYAIDSVITILFRLKRKENIFKPHRSHLYQYLANEYKMSHIMVASLFAIVQLIINLIVIFGIRCNYMNETMALSFFLVLTISYLGIRYRIISNFRIDH